MSEEQTTQAGPSHEAPATPTSSQGGIKSVEDAESPRQLTTMERIKILQKEISRIHDTNRCRDSEAGLYRSLATLLEEVRTDRTDRTPEVEMAREMAMLCDLRENARKPESPNEFKQEAYDRLLWFSNSWHEIDTLRVTGEAAGGRQLAIELIKFQKTWDLTNYPSELWRKQGMCELVMKLEEDYKESFEIADLMKELEPPRR